jgi:hypothetical protein
VEQKQAKETKWGNSFVVFVTFCSHFHICVHLPAPLVHSTLLFHSDLRAELFIQGDLRRAIPDSFAPSGSNPNPCNPRHPWFNSSGWRSATHRLVPFLYGLNCRRKCLMLGTLQQSSFFCIFPLTFSI